MRKSFIARKYGHTVVKFSRQHTNTAMGYLNTRLKMMA